jgi:hypothetical protein
MSEFRSKLPGSVDRAAADADFHAVNATLDNVPWSAQNKDSQSAMQVLPGTFQSPRWLKISMS